MRYDIQFLVTTSAKEQLYLKERTAWLLAREMQVPNTRISAVPFESDIYTPWAVFRQGLGSGTFGIVLEGFHPQTGELRAIKKLIIKPPPENTDGQERDRNQRSTWLLSRYRELLRLVQFAGREYPNGLLSVGNIPVHGKRCLFPGVPMARGIGVGLGSSYRTVQATLGRSCRYP